MLHGKQKKRSECDRERKRVSDGRGIGDRVRYVRQGRRKRGERVSAGWDLTWHLMCQFGVANRWNF
jgi:hypothetical protein